MSISAASSWEFGWEALVAIGTLALALVTFLLVLRTSRLAKWSETDVRAQWRPVILPDVESGYPISYNESQGVLTLRIHNGGRGPALYVRINVEPGGISPYQAPISALAAGGHLELIFRDVPKLDSGAQILFDYRDLTDRTYSTSMTMQTANRRATLYDVHLFTDHAITTLGDAVYPQPGLRDVSPRRRQGLRERARMVVRSLRGDF
jgi:hypothetical protein